MEQPIKTFEPNQIGRDFVIGDLHGSLTCFENLLRNLAFDKEKDRMFSVGDLVDRGPNSLGTLGLLREPWFHCVLSNHEQMMLEAFNGGYMGQFWYQNGGQWGQETCSTAHALQRKKNDPLQAIPLISDADFELMDLLVLVEQLPYLITINHKSGKKYHIIHAELPPGRVITDTDLADPDRVRKLAMSAGPGSADGDYFLWGRYQFMPFYKTDLSNRDKIARTVANKDVMFNEELSHVISGHTILQRPMTLLGQTNIDTCAYGSYSSHDYKVKNWCALTCIRLDDWTFCQATETEFRECDPVVINRSDLNPAKA